jgi:hypothetical protein
LVMPHSGIAFVSRACGAHAALLFSTNNQPTGVAVMSLERFVRNVAFALAAVVVVLGLSATFEYQPVINALAR